MVKKETYKEVTFYLKMDEELTAKDKNELHKFLMRMYPAFANYYKKNKYYSTVKPQMHFLVRTKTNKLVGSGKFLWRTVKSRLGNVKLFAFGVLIDPDFQSKGLGSHIIKSCIKEADKRNADLLYGTTANPAVGKWLSKLGLKKLKCKVYYTSTTGKKTREKNPAFVLEFKKGLVKNMNSLYEFNIGVGPL